mgnify:CR=1 FL=1
MGLVQNLKKRLGSWAEKILVELSYLYITQKAKQTSKKRNNSLLTESSQNNLTMEPQSTIIATSSQDTSEKIIMEKTTEEIVGHVRDWAMDKINIKNNDVPVETMMAITEEFDEWINIDDVDELEIISLEHIEEYLKD